MSKMYLGVKKKPNEIQAATLNTHVNINDFIFFHFSIISQAQDGLVHCSVLLMRRGSNICSVHNALMFE